MTDELFAATNDPAPAAAVTVLQEAVSGRVPKEYLDFLSTSNGANFVETASIRVAAAEGDVTTSLRSLHAADGDRGVLVMSSRMWSDGYLPDAMLVIGEDHHGNQICLGTSGESNGRVYFWDHERIDVDGDASWPVHDFEALTVAASSFGQFLEFAATSGGLDRPPTAVSAAPVADPGAIERRLREGWRFSAGDLVGPADATQVLRANDDPQLNHITDKVQLASFRDVEAIQQTSAPLAESWVPAEATFIADENRCDLPWAFQHNYGIVVRGPIADPVRTVFERFGELLPLACEDGSDLVVFHCTNVVDALDERARLAKPVGNYVGIRDFWFQPAAVEAAGIFVVPQQPENPFVFFTRPVVEELIGLGMRFIPFTTVWDAERDGGGPGTVLTG